MSVQVTNLSNNIAKLLAWIDFDGNGTFDADESAMLSVPTGTNALNMTLKWSDIPVDIQAGQTYARLRITTDSLSNRESNGAKRDGEVEDYSLTITKTGVTVSGRVFRDVNVNTESDTGEVGISRLPIVLYDTQLNTCLSTRTQGDGMYQFTQVLPGTYQIYEASRHKVPVPTNCGPSFAKDPSGYRSTTDNVRAAFTVTNSNISGQDFGDVKPPTFEASHRNQVLPGNVLFYAHRFTTPTKGNVHFTSVSADNTSAGWSSVIYQDRDCNGKLDGLEGSTAMTGTHSASTWVSESVSRLADSTLCLINKVYAPSNVAANDQYTQDITATFNYQNSVAGIQHLKVQDVTTAQQIQAPTTPETPEVVATPAAPSQPAQVATPNTPATSTTAEVPSTPYTPATDPQPTQAAVAATPIKPELGPSRLELRKTVRNLTKNSPETATVNRADPGDKLEYRIYYRNSGTGPLTELVVNDMLPPYTKLLGVIDCGTVISGMSCVANPVGLNDALSWTFSGALNGGMESFVSYQVLIED